jgi:hypothetical protein
MTIDYTDLKEYCIDPAEEVKNVKALFEQIVSLNSDNPTCKPRLALFDSLRERIFAIAARDYSDATDFKAVIAEMLQSYSSFKAESCILILDSHIVENNSVTSDCLNLYFMSIDSCHCLQLLYTVKDGAVCWYEDSHRLKQIDLKDHESISQEMIEILFVFTHVHSPVFHPRDLLSYYTTCGYQFRSFKDLNISYIDFTNAY